MANPSSTAKDLTASGLTRFEIGVIRRLGLEDALDGARVEATNSGLPGLARGPANAYQQPLISGELWRRLGPIAGQQLGGELVRVERPGPVGDCLHGRGRIQRLFARSRRTGSWASEAICM